MTQLFDEKGVAFACTVIEVRPHFVTQVKTEANDGYSAIQLGTVAITANDPRRLAKRTKKPMAGHFKKSGAPACRYLCEDRIENEDEFSLGQEITVDAFKDVTYVDAMAISKGKGFQGAIKLHNFSGGRATHGVSRAHRALGSTGMRTTPGRCFPGGKRASRMGFDRVTVDNLKVVEVNADEHYIIIKGAVPGPRDGLVYLTPAKKKA